MRRSQRAAGSLLLIVAAAASAQPPAPIRNAAGLRLLVADEDTQPVLRIVLPGQPLSDRSIEVIFPEHVTARAQQSGNEERLYLFRPGQQAQPPAWHRVGPSLEYETDFPPASTSSPAPRSRTTASSSTTGSRTTRQPPTV